MSNIRIIDFQADQKSLQEKNKKELLETLDEIRKLIEANYFTEFVSVALTSEGGAEVCICMSDELAAIGLLELGKSTIISNRSS